MAVWRWMIVLGIGVCAGACGVPQPVPLTNSAGDDGGARTDLPEAEDEGVEGGPSDLGGDDGMACNFAACGDLGPPLDTCDPFTQDCPTGEKCAPVAVSTPSSWDENLCVPVVDEPVGLYELCERLNLDTPLDGHDNCEVGATCWATLDGLRCHALCEGSADDPTCPFANDCFIPGSGVPSICKASCDPRERDCFNISLRCEGDGETVECVSKGDEPGEAYGTPCDDQSDCVEGLMCSTSVANCDDTCCTPFCTVGDPEPCPDTMSGMLCVAYFDQPVPSGIADLGTCVIP